MINRKARNRKATACKAIARKAIAIFIFQEPRIVSEVHQVAPSNICSFCHQTSPNVIANSVHHGNATVLDLCMARKFYGHSVFIRFSDVPELSVARRFSAVRRPLVVRWPLVVRQVVCHPSRKRFGWLVAPVPLEGRPVQSSVE